ncbi:MAG: hypothetical protein U1E22_04055, partial [Coriobacteriia bacterium]|nr:hypothetical protein [Coriobacteriia bacterium]
MSEVRFAFRVATVSAVLSVALLLAGCDVLTVMMDGVDAYESGEVPSASQKPAEQGDAPAPYYDTGDDATAAGATKEAPLFDNQNVLAVQNGGTSPTFEVPSTTTITKIETYLWN